MISKYNGTCVYCGKPTKAGVDHYDIENKRGYHSACEERQENAPPSAAAFSLAEDLGFIRYDPAMGADGLLRRMSRPDRGASTGRTDAKTHRGSNADLFEEE